MSHFSVLIIGKHPEEQLDPYWELDLPPDLLRNDPRAEFVTEVSAGDFEKSARQIIVSAEKSTAFSPRLAWHYRKLFREGRMEDILEDWFGGEKSDVGDWGYYRNPNAKWDWFSFGGRWAGKLVLRPGRTGVLSPESRNEPGEDEADAFSPLEVDQAAFGDIDWKATRESFSPFAVLKRGKWFDQGNMGWFGVARNRKDDAAWENEISRLLEGVSESEPVFIYDCHI